MNEKNIYESFIGKYFSEEEKEEFNSLLEASKEPGELDKLEIKSTEDLIEKAKKTKAKFLDHSYTTSDGLSLANDLLFKDTLFNQARNPLEKSLEKEEDDERDYEDKEIKKQKEPLRSTLSLSKGDLDSMLELYKEAKDEEDEDKKRRLSQTLARECIKLIEKQEIKFSAKIKKQKILKREDGSVMVIPTKGKQDQTFIKKDLTQSIADMLKATETNIENIKKTFDLEYVNSGKYAAFANLVKVRPFKNQDELVNMVAKGFLTKYLEELYEKNHAKAAEAYAKAKDIVRKSREQGKKPEDVLSAENWAALLFKALRDNDTGVKKLPSQEIQKIIIALEGDRVEGYKIAGKFLLNQIAKLSSHGREAPRTGSAGGNRYNM